MTIQNPGDVVAYVNQQFLLSSHGRTITQNMLRKKSKNKNSRSIYFKANQKLYQN